MINVKDELLTINKFSRSGSKIDCVKAIVIHWLANPMQTADTCRNFFEDRKNGTTGFGGAHYIVGLSGEIIRCIPENEVAYHVGSDMVDPVSGKIYTDRCRLQLTTGNPNSVTIGVEHCHTDWQGEMREETYNSSIELVAELCLKYKLDPRTDVLLHKEVVGWKNCNKWFVDHPKDWEEYKGLVLALYTTMKQ
jgi:N-acetylmuramoyl-L-alanine amidase